MGFSVYVSLNVFYFKELVLMLTSLPKSSQEILKHFGVKVQRKLLIHCISDKGAVPLENLERKLNKMKLSQLL